MNRNAKQQGIIFTLHNHTDEQIVQAAAGKISSQFDGYFLPIFYQTGTAVTVRTPGFDLMSLGLFRDEIRQAMREKRAVISRTFGRLTEQDRQSLGRIFAPVEVKGKVLGMITLLLDMRRFMEQIATRQSGRPVPFEIYDETDHNKLPVFHWPAKAAFSAGDTELPQVDRQVPFFDHTWKLVHVATDNYAKSFETRLPLILLAGGFAFTLAIYLIMRHAQIKAEQALAHSNAQYWELEQTNRRLNNKIIERGTFESAHQELQQRLTDFQMLVDGYFWELDTDCKLTYLSRQAIKWTGKPVTKAINTHFTKHLHEDDAIELRHLMEQALAENRTFTMEVRALGEKNRWRWEKVFGKPLFDENELPIGFRGYSHDITAFKQLRLQMEQAIAGDELFYGETSSSCR